jgi:hypothetical protein
MVLLLDSELHLVTACPAVGYILVKRGGSTEGEKMERRIGPSWGAADR